MTTQGRSQDPGEERRGLDSFSFDELLREVLDRVHGVLDERSRLQLLLDAVVGMSGDLSLDGVLDRIVRTASTLLDARYAALGVLGANPGRRMRTFIYHGVSEEQAAAIGAPPRGHGLLGLLIDHPEPVRLSHLQDHPASYGIPSNHPPMSSFLGVPVLTHGRVYGNLYLAEKIGADEFSELDQDIAVGLAAAAGVAIESAQLYEEAAVRERWLAATAEVTAVLSGSVTGADALQTIADRAREVAKADASWIISGDSPDDLRVRVVSGIPFTSEARAVSFRPGSLPVLVVEKHEPISVEDISSDPRAVGPTLPGWPEHGSAIVVPIRTGSDTRGVLALSWAYEHSDRFHLMDASLPASFAEQATVALNLAQASEDRQRLAVLEDRDRIGRDLHDVVIQRLFAVGLGLQGTARLVDHPEAVQRMERAVDDLDLTIQDIRRTIFALGWPDHADDIESGVARVVERARVALKFRPRLEFAGPVRTLITGAAADDVLAAVSEALANASRHAEPSQVEVRLEVGDRIELTVTDDGRGLPADIAESGLANIRQRAEQHGGTCVVESQPGEGTRVIWSIPLPGAR